MGETKTLRQIYEQQNADVRLTDKAVSKRNHLDLYSFLFEEYRLSADSIFEIGINRGGSIRLWEEYFPRATVYGLDIRPSTLRRVSGDRIVTQLLDQSSKQDLLRFGQNCGPFDIGIDDGSHIWSHQILSFETLWPFIAPGGVYVVEDTQTSYRGFIESSKSAKRIVYNDSTVSAVEYFKSLADHINFDGVGSATEDVANHTDHQRTVDWVLFRTNSVVIRKRDVC